LGGWGIGEMGEWEKIEGEKGCQWSLVIGHLGKGETDEGGKGGRVEGWRLVLAR